MNEALRSVFGDNILGIATLVVMLVFIAPKFVVWWRTRRQRKREEAKSDERAMGLRRLSYEWEKPELEADPKFGEAYASLSVKRGYVLVRSLVWLIPFIFNYFMPLTWSMRKPLFALTLPLLCIGLWGLSHLLDKTVFYETGFVSRNGFSKRKIDYNAITDFEKRVSTFSGVTQNFIFQIEDESPVDFVCARYENGARTIARVIKGLSPRQIRSEAAEISRLREH